MLTCQKIALSSIAVSTVRYEWDGSAIKLIWLKKNYFRNYFSNYFRFNLFAPKCCKTNGKFLENIFQNFYSSIISAKKTQVLVLCVKQYIERLPISSVGNRQHMHVYKCDIIFVFFRKTTGKKTFLRVCDVVDVVFFRFKISKKNEG